MADYWALSSSNWSNLSNWLTGVSLTAGALPGPFDNVYANGRTITVDGDYRVNLVTNGAGTNSIAGGRFLMNNLASLSALIIGGANNVTCVQFLSATPNRCTIVGNLCAFNPAVQLPGPCLSNNGIMTLIGDGLQAINNGSSTTAGTIML